MLKALLEEKKKAPRKIRLSFYPYTYVRTTVMRTLLLKKESYHKLLKMDFNEIARFLGETTYKHSIDKLASSLSGADLIEVALNRNLSESFEKLRRISSEELRLLVNEYLKRKDIEDIKTILRGKFVNADPKTIENSLQAAGTLSMDFLLGLMKKDFEQLLKSVPFIDYQRSQSFKKAVEKLKKEGSLVEIENELDRQYYTSLLDFSKSIPKQGELFKEFLTKEIEMQNILTILRLKHAKIDKNTIASFVFFTDNKLYKNTLMKLIDSDDSSMIKLLVKPDYANIIASGLKSYEETGSLIMLETSLYKYLLKKSILMVHQHLLSIDVILGYMFAKDMEVKNLKIIVKGRQLGLSPEFIESQLVF